MIGPALGRAIARHRRVAAAALAIGLLVFYHRAWAQSPPAGGAAPAPLPSVLQIPTATPPQAPQVSDIHNPAALDYVIQQPLFGELSWRRKLHEAGVDLVAHYVSETAGNALGGESGGTAYAQQVDFGVSFDLGKLGIWTDATARFAMTDRAGRSLAADRTGSYFAFQEIYGQGQNLRFNEISIEKAFLNKTVALKLGFYPLGNDFGTLPYVCNFQNVALCGHPQSLPVNSGWSDAPAGRWGARVLWHVSEAVQVRVGVFDVNPLITQKQNGFKLDFEGSTGVIVPVEFTYQMGRKPSDYGGTYKLGAYYDTSSAPDLVLPQVKHFGRYGVYLEAAQQVFKTGPDRRNGLALFAIFTTSDRDTAKFSQYYEAGAAYRGLVPGRELDILSLGWARADINDRYRQFLVRSGQPAQTNEQVIELNYGWQALPSLTIKPGVQYNVRPGANPAKQDVLVGALQVKLTL